MTARAITPILPEKPGITVSAGWDNGAMAILEGLLTVGAMGLVLYAVIRALQSRPGAPGSGRRSVARRPLRRQRPHKSGGAQGRARWRRILDEHVIAEIPVDDPDYDVLFMTAMATARQRKAIFETEE